MCEHVSTICQLHDNILESCIKVTVKPVSRSKPLRKNKLFLENNFTGMD